MSTLPKASSLLDLWVLGGVRMKEAGLRWPDLALSDQTGSPLAVRGQTLGSTSDRQPSLHLAKRRRRHLWEDPGICSLCKSCLQYAKICVKYAQYAKKSCIICRKICQIYAKQYAKICKKNSKYGKYAKKNICTMSKKYAKQNMHEICKNMHNMQKQNMLQICKKICNKYAKTYAKKT